MTDNDRVVEARLITRRECAVAVARYGWDALRPYLLVPEAQANDADWVTAKDRLEQAAEQ